MDGGILGEIAGLDYGAVAARISGEITGLLEGAGAAGAVFGMSGGVDSAALAYLCARAAGGRALALVMPDTSVTPESETGDAMRMVSITGLEHRLVDIAPIVREYSMYVEPDEAARANLRARVRASLLYYYANARGYLVLGSSDRSERSIGYFTKFGDGACDAAPLASLYKLQVRGLARHLGVPEGVVSKASSPHLRPGRDAEGELGMTYEEIDAALYCTDELGLGPEEAAARAGIGEDRVGRVLRMRAASAHKRAAPGAPHAHT